MERFVSTTAELTLVPRPGLAIATEGYATEGAAILKFTGTLGVRELSRLIEEATALKAELSEAIG